MRINPVAQGEDLPLILTAQQAFDLLGISKNTGYALLREGQIPHLRLGRQIRIPRAALLKMLEETRADRVG